MVLCSFRSGRCRSHPIAAVAFEFDTSLQHLAQLAAVLLPENRRKVLRLAKRRGRAVAAASARAGRRRGPRGPARQPRGVDARMSWIEQCVSSSERFVLEQPAHHHVALGIAVVGPLDQQQFEIEDLGVRIAAFRVCSGSTTMLRPGKPARSCRRRAHARPSSRFRMQLSGRACARPGSAFRRRRGSGPRRTTREQGGRQVAQQRRRHGQALPGRFQGRTRRTRAQPVRGRRFRERPDRRCLAGAGRGVAAVRDGRRPVSCRRVAPRHRHAGVDEAQRVRRHAAPAGRS